MGIINTYLTFAGNAEEAFNFYRSVFGGEFPMIMRFKDSPESGNVSENEQDKIMHIGLPVGNGNMLMASDALGTWGQNLKQGNNYHISLSPASEDEANKLFNGLSAGGHISVPLDKAFWGSYFGMFTDKFGIQWMVNYDPNQQQ